MKNEKLKTKHIALTLLILFIIDRTSKYITYNKLPSQGVCFFDYLKIKLQMNRGIAFGIPLPFILITSLTIIILLFLFYYLLKNIKKNKKLNALFLGLIIIGAFSNLLDRFFYQKVIDFIQIGIFPIFNIADTYISIGAILLLIQNTKKDPQK